MPRGKLTGLSVFLLFSLALAAGAEERVFDFRPQPSPSSCAKSPAGNPSDDRNIVATHVIPRAALSDSGVGQLAVGDTLSVFLFSDEPLRIRLAERTPGADVSFLGTLDESDGILDTVVIGDRSGIQMDIRDFRHGRVYTVYSSESGTRVTEWAEPKEPRTCRTLEPPLPQSAATGMPQKAPSVGKSSSSALVDVLVAYDTTAVSWLAEQGYSLDSFANISVQKMNEAIANTDLDSKFRFRLVGTVETGSSARGSLQGALYAAAGQPVSVNGEVISWPAVKTTRNELGADIVCVLIDTGNDWGTVGLGYSMTASTRSWFSDSTFNACAIRAVVSSHTMTHEVGHNMGAGHTDMGADESNRGPQLFSYSSGYYFSAGGSSYSTIMAYTSDGYGNYYTEVPYFSSPLHSHEGTRVGDATHDNSRTLANTFAEVAAYRTASMPVDPPATPTGVAASNGTYDDKVQVTWNSAGGATGYEVWRSESATGEKTKLGTTTATSWDDGTAVPEKVYWYWIKASNGAGTSSFSASASGYCTRTVARTIGEGLDAPQFVWTTNEQYPWTYTQEISDDGVDSVRSGGIDGYDTTWIETEIQGPADITFKYRKNFYGSRFFASVDGNECFSDSQSASGDYTWRLVSFSIGSGVHAIRLSYTHNGMGYAHVHNGVWIDQFMASGGTPPSGLATQTTPVAVPHAWLEENAAAILSENGGDHEMAANARAANGKFVWECYLVGLSTTSEEETFAVTSISFVDGVPELTWSPDLGDARKYVVESVADMGDEWEASPDEPQFFRVKVSMP